MAATAAGHHSPAIFDQTREIELQGRVTEFEWGTPHCWIHVDVLSEQGFIESWRVEMGPPTYIARGGWTATTIQPGDAVTVIANPMRNGQTMAKFVLITLATGHTLSEEPPGPHVNNQPWASRVSAAWAWIRSQRR